MTAEEKLTEALCNRDPVLFLGAGFSLGATNKEGKALPSAGLLARELYDVLLDAQLTAQEKAKFFSEESKKSDLQYVCDVIDSKKLTKQRDEWLTKRFYGCRCADGDPHFLIKEYPWRTVFTLNIDDLVENIYDKKINVQLLGGESNGTVNYPTLIKLHGSVSKPEGGYIFSKKEYQRYLGQDAWAINAFGTEYFRNDFVFLGTEFQEDDLHGILERFSEAGAVTSAHEYFFVTPEIRNGFLEMQIEQTDNFHHIRMNTEQFLRFLVENVVIKDTQRKRMKSLGARFLDEIKKEYRPSYLNVGSLYQGDMPQFDDFFGDWDIRYPQSEYWVRDIAERGTHRVVALYGESYVGKTCVAMRMAVDFYNKGYTAFAFSMCSDLDADKYARILLEYLGTLPAETKCVVMAENMAYFYDSLKYVVEKCPKNIKQLVLVVTANIEEHNTKKYFFDRFDRYEQHHIDFKINSTFAHNIYDKLEEKSHLNNLLKYAEGERGGVRYIKSVNDVIDVLYISQEGRKFSEHFAAWVAKAGDNGAAQKAFEVLCFLGELDIYDVPIPFFRRLTDSLCIRVSFDELYRQYKEYLLLDKDMVKVRCLRILKDHVLKNMSRDEKYNILFYAACYYAPQLRDRGLTVQDRILQQLIKVKKLCSGKILDNESILRLLVSLEDKAKHLSYYWIQRGIANRNLEIFEEANNAFLTAAKKRGVLSYNIEHAQAKNYMTWGVWELNHNDADALDLFERGQCILKNLIDNSPRRYFVYSVHSYTDMMIKYYETVKSIPDRDELRFIVDRLNGLPQEEDENYTSHVIAKFKRFCRKNGIQCNGLRDSHATGTDFVDIDDLGNE